MTTLRQWFDKFTDATGEEPTHIVFGLDYWNSDGRWPELVSDELVPWDDVAASALDREFDAGYGGNNAPDFCAWSPSWVIFCDNYDGAESICCVPRSPVAHEPIRPGGG